MTIFKGIPATANIALVEGLFGNLQNIIRPPVAVEPVTRLTTKAPELKGLMLGTDHALQNSYTIYSEASERYAERIDRFQQALPSTDWEDPRADTPLVKDAREILEEGQSMRVWLTLYNARVTTIGPMHPIARRFQLTDRFKQLAHDHQPIHHDVYAATRSLDESLAYFVSITTPYLPAFRQMIARFDGVRILTRCTPELESADTIIKAIEWSLSPELHEQALGGALIGAQRAYGATPRTEGSTAATFRVIDRAHEDHITADNVIDALIVDLNALATPGGPEDDKRAASRALHFALKRIMGGEGNPDFLIDELIHETAIDSEISKMLRYYKNTRTQTHLKQGFFDRLGKLNSANSIVVTAIASFLESPESMRLAIERAANLGASSHMRAVIAGVLSGAYNGSLSPVEG